MAITINPDTMVVSPTSDPNIFLVVCDVTKNGTRTTRVSVKLNTNMNAAGMKNAIRKAQDDEDDPLVSADAFKAELINTTLADIMEAP